MVRKVDDTMMLEPQQDMVRNMVPMARTSIGKKSVDIPVGPLAEFLSQFFWKRSWSKENGRGKRGQKLTCCVADGDAVGRHEEDDEDEHDNGRSADDGIDQRQGLSVDRDEREGNGDRDEASRHTPSRAQ